MRPAEAIAPTVVIPFDDRGDRHRAAAFDYVRAWYGEHHPGWPVVVGGCSSGTWSKGAAVRDGVDRSTSSVLVLADADSFVTDPGVLTSAVHAVHIGRARWVMPHDIVYRLTEDETARILPGRLPPRLRRVHRDPYRGTVGGGITVIARDAFELVGGIDDRFEGWGGEDVAFGYALETLVHPVHRLDGRLAHLWHPHPAPDLRGSPAAEALVAEYTAARGVRRRMRALVDRAPWEPPPPLTEPVRYRMRDARRSLRLPSGQIIRFDQTGHHETTDADIAELLDEDRRVRRVRH